MDNTNEKRQFHRVENNFNVRIAKQISKDIYKDILLDNAHSINISASGILINIKELISIDEIVRVTFLQPNTFDFFEGSGIVVRVEKAPDGSCQVGINFVDLTESKKRRLDYYINLCE